MWQLNNLPFVTQLVSNRARIRTRYLTPEPTLLMTVVYAFSASTFYRKLSSRMASPISVGGGWGLPVRSAMAQAPTAQLSHMSALPSCSHMVEDFIQLFNCSSKGRYLSNTSLSPLLLPSEWTAIMKWDFPAFLSIQRTNGDIPQNCCLFTSCYIELKDGLFPVSNEYSVFIEILLCWDLMVW